MSNKVPRLSFIDFLDFRFGCGCIIGFWTFDWIYGVRVHLWIGFSVGGGMHKIQLWAIRMGRKGFCVWRPRLRLMVALWRSSTTFSTQISCSISGERMMLCRMVKMVKWVSQAETMHWSPEKCGFRRSDGESYCLSFGHGPSNMLEMKFRMRYHFLAELICVWCFHLWRWWPFNYLSSWPGVLLVLKRTFFGVHKWHFMLLWQPNDFLTFKWCFVVFYGSELEWIIIYYYIQCILQES